MAQLKLSDTAEEELGDFRKGLEKLGCGEKLCPVTYLKGKGSRLLCQAWDKANPQAGNLDID